MVVEKCPPPLRRIATAPHPPQMTSHGPFGDLESQFQQFAMYLGRSPIRVFLGQALDQLTNLLRDLRSSAGWLGAPTPVEAETSAVPADNGGRLDDDEDLGPAGPIAAQAGPKKFVQPV